MRIASTSITCMKIVLAFENASSPMEEVTNATASSTTLAVAHDSSAEEIRQAVLSLADHSLDRFIGDLQVSREVNGAEGLQAYR